MVLVTLTSFLICYRQYIFPGKQLKPSKWPLYMPTFLDPNLPLQQANYSTIIWCLCLNWNNNQSQTSAGKPKRLIFSLKVKNIYIQVEFYRLHFSHFLILFYVWLFAFKLDFLIQFFHIKFWYFVSLSFTISYRWVLMFLSLN